jgi:hypothetical protein
LFSERQKIADQKNIERMKKELERTLELMKVTNEDLASVTIINNATKDQLQAQEDKALHTEESLKVSVSCSSASSNSRVFPGHSGSYVQTVEGRDAHQNYYAFKNQLRLLENPKATRGRC